MARDLVLARQVVETVLDEIMATTLGEAVIRPMDLLGAIERSISEVADLLDPDELDDAFDDDDEAPTQTVGLTGLAEANARPKEPSFDHIVR